jgi:hypothetical protein
VATIALVELLMVFWLSVAEVIDALLELCTKNTASMELTSPMNSKKSVFLAMLATTAMVTTLHLRKLALVDSIVPYLLNTLVNTLALKELTALLLETQHLLIVLTAIEDISASTRELFPYLLRSTLDIMLTELMVRPCLTLTFALRIITALKELIIL